MPHLYHVDVGAITTFQLENTIQVNIQDEFTTGTEMFSEIFNCVLNDAYKNGDFTSTSQFSRYLKPKFKRILRHFGNF